MSGKRKNYFAIMHIGSEQIFLRLVQYTGIEDIKLIESATKKVFLVTETFKTDRIGFERVNEVCELLLGYKRLLCEYGVKDYRLIATTALREAYNKTYIIDQIRIKTGFETEIIDMPQSLFYVYCAAYRNMHKYNMIDSDEGTLFVDVSAGGLGLVLYHNDEIKYQQNIHLSIMRIQEKFTRQQIESVNFKTALTEYADTMLKPIAKNIRDYKLKYLVFSGVENQLLLELLEKKTEQCLIIVTFEELLALYEKMKFLNAPQIMKIYNISYEIAETIGTVLVMYKCIISAFKAEQVIFMDVNLVDGVILNRVAEKTADVWQNLIEKKIMSMVYALGKRYEYDEKHTESVEEIALHFFDAMSKIHGLNKRDRLLLRVAAVLHDIGKFVSMRQHYIHSYRLMQSAEIIGLSEEEKETVANVIYYHSRSLPSKSDERFSALLQREQVRVSKLAAIIRMADAVDRGYMQKISLKSVRLRGDELIVKVHASTDISLEEWTFEEKADFFEEVFGISPRLLKV